jgi:hypothetical protein
VAKVGRSKSDRTISLRLQCVVRKNNIIKPRNTSKFASRELRCMIAGRRLPTAWLFIFEVRKVCVLFMQKRKEKCLAYTRYVMSQIAPVRAMKVYGAVDV